MNIIIWLAFFRSSASPVDAQVMLLEDINDVMDVMKMYDEGQISEDDLLSMMKTIDEIQVVSLFRCFLFP